jgi:hypothetical protein
MKDCNTCFFKGSDINEQPCVDCGFFDKWVSKEAFVDEAPKTMIVEGVKFDNNKAQWSLMPWKALSQVVDVLTYGAKKYAPDNWKKVPNARQRYVDASFRHLTAYVGGEKNDSETGMSHLAHAMCCLLFLLAFDLGEDK